MPKKYTQKKCHCGNCHNHRPQWVETGREVLPAPFLGFKQTLWTHKCCGKAMRRRWIIRNDVCALCGAERKKDKIKVLVAMCSCCKKFRLLESIFGMPFDQCSFIGKLASGGL